MRGELVEVDESDEGEPSEITEVMDKYFRDINRIELATVVSRRKRVHGFVKQEELSRMLVESSLYRITNLYNKKYVCRL